MPSEAKKYRFIVMLDILGFKNIVREKSIDQVHAMVNALFDSINKGVKRDFMVAITMPGDPPPSPTPHNTVPIVRLDHFIFSDTILVWKDIDARTDEQGGKLKVGCDELTPLPWLVSHHGLCNASEDSAPGWNSIR